MKQKLSKCPCCHKALPYEKAVRHEGAHLCPYCRGSIVWSVSIYPVKKSGTWEKRKLIKEAK